MQDIPVDLPDALWLQNYFAHYANPKARIERLVRQGLLFRLKRGLYIRPEAANDEYVIGRAANRLYGPSYVSFLYAMRWYGMIPEHVAHITSATFKKGKTKRYDTPVGSFFYRDIPARAFPYGITFVGEGQTRFLIASAEKALCDELYRASGIRSIGKMETLLFEDLRLDQAWFKGIDHNMLISLAKKYRTVTLNTFSRFITKLANHA